MVVRTSSRTAPARLPEGRRTPVSVPAVLGGYDWRFTAGAGAAGLAAVVLVTALLALGGPEALALVRDPTSVARAGDPLPPYVGWISSAGVLLWAAAAGALATAARAGLAGRRRLAAVHGVGAVLTAFLATDDLLLLHDRAFIRYFGVSEAASQVALAAVLAVWVLASLRVLRADPALPVLGLALVLLATSVLHDVGVPTPPVHEEAVKFGGIVCWALWAWGSARWAIAAAARPDR